MQMSIEHDNFTNLQQSKFNFDLRSIGIESERTECNFNLHRNWNQSESSPQFQFRSNIQSSRAIFTANNWNWSRNRNWNQSLRWRWKCWNRSRSRKELQFRRSIGIRVLQFLRWIGIRVRERGSEFVRDCERRCEFAREGASSWERERVWAS
jgi:hypothetical protein